MSSVSLALAAVVFLTSATAAKARVIVPAQPTSTLAVARADSKLISGDDASPGIADESIDAGAESPDRDFLLATARPGDGRISPLEVEAGDACYYLPGGPFGYSITFCESLVGLDLRSADSSHDLFDWVFACTSSCSQGQWFGGAPWAGFNSASVGWESSDAFGVGCHGAISLSVTGEATPGSSLNVSFRGPGPDPTPFTAVGLGSAVGAGMGGDLAGDCSWDVGLAPGMPPASAVLGRMPVDISFRAATPAGATPGTHFGVQWVQKDTITGVVSTSNVVEIFVP